MSFNSPKTPGVVSLRYIIMSVLNLLGDYSMRNYYRLMQIAISGYKILNLWHLDNIEVVYLEMNTAKVVTLPSDFVDWLKIGVPINGKLRVLTNHKQILLPRAFPDGTPVGNTDADGTVDAASLVYFSDHFRGGQFVGGLFGMAGGVDDAYYRFDREMGTIVFTGSVTRSQIVLEYISSGVKAIGSTMIPIECEPALRTYVLWQRIEYDSRTSLSEKQRRKNDHEEEIEALRSFQSIFTKEEYQNMLRKTYRQTPKR
jgi:hypothetical protein